MSTREKKPNCSGRAFFAVWANGQIMEVIKSSRHAKLTGDFAESLVAYWLSKYGFECAVVDHTGIDIIARNPHTQEIMGISVKSRSRTTGKEHDHMNIPNDNFEKAKAACKAFGCVPYFAVVIDAGQYIYLFILSQKNLLRLHPKGKKVATWKMSPAWLKRYEDNKNIIFVCFEHETVRWWGRRKAVVARRKAKGGTADNS